MGKPALVGTCKRQWVSLVNIVTTAFVLLSSSTKARYVPANTAVITNGAGRRPGRVICCGRCTRCQSRQMVGSSRSRRRCLNERWLHSRNLSIRGRRRRRDTAHSAGHGGQLLFDDVAQARNRRLRLKNGRTAQAVHLELLAYESPNQDTQVRIGGRRRVTGDRL